MELLIPQLPLLVQLIRVPLVLRTHGVEVVYGVTVLKEPMEVTRQERLVLISACYALPATTVLDPPSLLTLLSLHLLLLGTTHPSLVLEN